MNRRYTPPTGEYHYIAEKLRQLRVETDFSQQNIADVLHVNRSTYTYYETGKTIPDVRTLKKLAQIFGISMDDFFPLEETGPCLADVTPSGKQRPRKAVADDPQKVGDLTPAEKSLIALFRSDERLSAEETFQVLRDKLTELDEKICP